MRRLLLLSLLLAGTGIGTVALPWRPMLSRADAPVYRTAAVERGDIVATVTAAGALSAVVLVDVSSQISGQLRELHADFNSAVQQDQVIARIAPETYEAKVAQAEAELEIAQSLVPMQRAQIERGRAELENAQAAHATAKAQTLRAEILLEEARRDLERRRPLFDRSVVSTSEWEKVQSAHQAVAAQLAAARAEEMSRAAAIRAAEAAVRVAEAQVANNLAQARQREAALRQAQTDLERTYIRAPVTGTVVNRAVSRGQTVAASLAAPTLFTIAQDLTRMQVQASVVEADVGRFAVGQLATFTVDAFPGHTFRGAVMQVRKAPLTVQNVVTYTVVISAENPDQALLPGMTANLRVVVARRGGVLKVQNTALRFRPAGVPREGALPPSAGGTAGEDAGDLPGVPGRVFVVGPEGQPVPVSLRGGATDGRMTEVLAGDLTEGQAVITGTAPSTAQATAAQGPRLAGFRLL
jgi:HlyD family secretion protein